MHRSECPSSAELAAFQQGNLTEAVVEEIAEHLDHCPRCESAARALDGQANSWVNALRRSVRSPASPRTRETRQTIGDYEILGELGQGSMAIVFRARHVHNGRTVALKRLREAVCVDPDRHRRFFTEARAMARLRHPHIVQVFDVGEYETELSVRCPYFTLELAEGGSLADRLAGQPQPPQQAAAWLELLARAVHYAHEQGIVHRDLKPSNVLLTRAGKPKLCDFGVAKLLEGGPVQSVSGLLIGTAEYMAPEQAACKGGVGPATDVYGLGALLYAMLTGRPPFQGRGVLATLQRVQKQEPVPPSRLQPQVPASLEAVCLKCLRKEPGQRYATAAALADELKRLLGKDEWSKKG
jgi:serine/threonine protein kinase